MMLPGLALGHRMHVDFSGLPAGLEEDTLALLEQEHHEFEAVVGVPVDFVAAAPGTPAWVVHPREAGLGPALVWDPKRLRLTSYADDEADLMASLQLLQSIPTAPDWAATATPVMNVSAAADRIEEQCRASYPYLRLRGLDWDRISAEARRDQPSQWEDFTGWAMEWVARLGDAHTAVIDETTGAFNPPYTAELGYDGARLLIVPERSAAYEAGVRPGWRVRVEDAGRWWASTGACAQQRARVAARRFLALTAESRTFTASDPGSGRTVSWVEERRDPTLDDVVTVHRNRSGTVVVTLRAMNAAVDVESVFDDLAPRSGSTDHMVLDLRGNTGGNLMLAGRLRDRFLRRKTHLGSIAFTNGQGGLGERHQRWSSPSEHGRWAGRLTVLTDASTYSASEDFLLGLQGLEHVTVLGEVTGGGSGRPRTFPLSPATSLRISTAITYDRAGEPVEYRGIHPDRSLSLPVADL